MITGLNHITLSVRDLEVSFRFYVDVLGLKPIVRRPRIVYLSAGELWLALFEETEARTAVLSEYTHLALSVAKGEFEALSRRIRDSGAQLWQENDSEGESFYFLDPTGHKLEIHVGSLETRIASLRQKADQQTTFFV